jgi:hypothetical protein
VVEIDNSVRTAKERDRRANFDTRSVIAMVTPQHCKVPPRVGINSFFDVLDPSAIYADSNVVLFLARYRARMTADATVLIDNEPVAHS